MIFWEIDRTDAVMPDVIEQYDAAKEWRSTDGLVCDSFFVTLLKRAESAEGLMRTLKKWHGQDAQSVDGHQSTHSDKWEEGLHWPRRPLLLRVCRQSQ